MLATVAGRASTGVSIGARSAILARFGAHGDWSLAAGASPVLGAQALQWRPRFVVQLIRSIDEACAAILAMAGATIRFAVGALKVGRAMALWLLVDHRTTALIAKYRAHDAAVRPALGSILHRNE